MSLNAADVVVAGTGTVWVAPEGTALPTDLDPLASPWTDVGYVSEDGVTFTIGRETEDILAWQAAEAIRVLTTSEPKTVAFDFAIRARMRSAVSSCSKTGTGRSAFAFKAS